MKRVRSQQALPICHPRAVAELSKDDDNAGRRDKNVDDGDGKNSPSLRERSYRGEKWAETATGVCHTPPRYGSAWVDKTAPVSWMSLKL
ncbi:hypothetical protein Zmor_010099 [Zophobas morio]|uniref:Uncharacterized protein n=1 Tax=Zophobas morio TaxID=2755281 RepID=A0AA38MJE0_9CUCU|nr:hypothetical protein Zmor_010099 [Zophobas morio]